MGGQQHVETKVWTFKIACLAKTRKDLGFPECRNTLNSRRGKEGLKCFGPHELLTKCSVIIYLDRRSFVPTGLA